jgi:hypothetical protein
VLGDDPQPALFITCRDQLRSPREGAGLAGSTRLAAQAFIELTAGFCQDQRAQQSGMAFRNAHGDMATPRVAEQRHRLLLQRADEGSDIGDMGVDAEIPAGSRPAAGPAVAHGQRHHVVARCSERGHLCGKAPLIAQRAVHHQQRTTSGAGFRVVDLGSVHVQAGHRMLLFRSA